MKPRTAFRAACMGLAVALAACTSSTGNAARLTTGSLRSLNAQVVLDGRRARAVAEAWLCAQGLMRTGGVAQ